MVKLGDRMALLRKAKGLKQVDVARMVGVARTTYAMYEQGRRDPDISTLDKIADLFEVSVDYLTSGTSLGQQTREARLAKGLTLGELADVSGVDINIIRVIEESNQDTYSLPPSELAKLAITLSDDPRHFLLRTSQKYRFNAMDFIDEHGGLRQVIDSGSGELISVEELEFIRFVKAEVSPFFFTFFYYVTQNRRDWVRPLKLVLEMLVEGNSQ